MEKPSKENFFFLFEFLDEVEKEMSKDQQKQVMIEKAINMKLMCDFVVSCSYGDIVLIICMLRDYLKLLDEYKDELSWDYYRMKFRQIADRLQDQIDYDYDAAVIKCQKNQRKQESNSDIGEDAFVLATKQKKQEGET